MELSAPKNNHFHCLCGHRCDRRYHSRSSNGCLEPLAANLVLRQGTHLDLFPGQPDCLLKIQESRGSKH